jgi:hypothetical protein
VTTFKDQFDRMGFSVPEMIQVVACGHTIGGVHTTEFPDIVPAGTSANGEVGLDSSVATFDNKVVTEYLDNSTMNPLVVGPAVKINKHADFKVFSADQNVTMKGLRDPAVFQSTCKTVLQKMIDVVPGGVVLTDPITPYTVKPVNMQLTLNTPGSTLLLSGYIRVRTTNLPSSSISNIKLTYKDRNGGNNCGTCSTTATVQGSATGFDDSFGFFPISASIDAQTGISSFTVTINLKDGTSQTYDNNGNSYPMSDAVLLQKPQSCLLQGSGALTATALVRNDRTSLPVNLGISYLVPRNTRDGNPVPALNNVTVAMTKGSCVGQYTFYSASYSIPGGLSYNAKLDIVSGSGAHAVSDSFNAASELGGTCGSFAGGVACGGSTSSSTSSSSASTSSTSTSKSSSTTSTGTSSSTSAAPTLSHRSKIGAYNLVGCWTEGQGTRALTGAAFASDDMTLEKCAAACAGFTFWGTEYGRECYCGSEKSASSGPAPLSDCNMVCAGDATQYCGSGNRIELYSNAAQSSSSSGNPSTSTSRSSASSTSSTSKPTTSSTSTSATSASSSTTSSSAGPSQTLGHRATIGKYSFVGCVTEGTGIRALSSSTYADDAMTLESCASFCDAYMFFGTEYGRECYCGNLLASSSTPAPLSDCSMTCKGNPWEICGNGNRIELYRVAAVSSGVVSSSTAVTGSTSSTRASTTSASFSAPTSTRTSATSSASTASPTGPTQPATVSVGGSTWKWKNCYTEATTGRALAGATYASDSVTLESCATFCSSYAFFGTEYGRECYCGNGFTAGSVAAPAADCSFKCAGNAGELCGAGNRLSVYAKQ